MSNSSLQYDSLYRKNSSHTGVMSMQVAYSLEVNKREASRDVCLCKCMGPESNAGMGVCMRPLHCTRQYTATCVCMYAYVCMLTSLNDCNYKRQLFYCWQ